MKKLLILSLFSLCFSITFAQETEPAQVKDAISSTTKIDIEDETIMAMVEGLMNTPIYENSDRMANLTHMFVQWVIETDKVSVHVLPYFGDIIKTNSSLSIPYLCGWVSYSHDNQWEKNDFPLAENLSAIKSVINYYRKNEDKLLTDPYVIELEEKLKAGTLSDYLRGQIEE